MKRSLFAIALLSVAACRLDTISRIPEGRDGGHGNSGGAAGAPMNADPHDAAVPVRTPDSGSGLHPAADSGMAAVDAARPDSAVPEMDASTPTHDAGPAAMDSSTPGMDSATPDAGTRAADSSAPTHDSGAIKLDAAADSGAIDPSLDGGDEQPRIDGCPDDAPLAPDRVRLWPAAGQSAQLVGAHLQGSNSGPTTDFVDLAVVSQVPAEGKWTELRFVNTTLYRYLRYYAPPGSQGSLAELQFYHGTRKLTGAAFGTAGTSPALVQDGNVTTYSTIVDNGGGYIGLDIAGGYVTGPVTFTPPGGTQSTTAIDVTLTSATSGATIRYALDNADLTIASRTFSLPVQLTARTTVRAFAASACRFDSEITAATFRIGAITPVTEGLKSYHIGNSLTDTINKWLKPIADSTGVTHTYARWTIPGAPIKYLAEHQGDLTMGFATPAEARYFDMFVQTYAPIDHLTIQPYSDPNLTSQGGAAVGLLTTALQFSPNVQFWIYAQWPGKTEWSTDAMSVGYSGWQVAHQPTNWAEGTQNYALYFEAFRDYVDARVAGKSFLIVPAGLALVELKRQVDAGLIPGFTDFFASFFEDEVHLTAPAQYLVALVFYSCLYRQTPENRVTTADTQLTPEQAAFFQRIAWSVASGYTGSGIGP